MGLVDHLRSAMSLVVLTANLSFWGVGLVLLGLLKALVPASRGWADRRLAGAYRGAVAVNDAWLRRVIGLDWARPETGLDRDEICIVVSNHGCWADILLVQSAVTRDGPLLKFLTKRELLFIPVLGVIFWAFDFPLLRRGKRRGIDKAEQRRLDAEALASACDVVRTNPAALMNFAEGTRFTEEKRAKTESPYRHLLPPRVGGLAALIEALGDDATSVVDVSLLYPEPASFWRFLSGRTERIEIEVERIPMERVPLDRDAIALWLAERWQAKDDRIERVRSGAAVPQEQS